MEKARGSINEHRTSEQRNLSQADKYQRYSCQQDNTKHTARDIKILQVIYDTCQYSYVVLPAV